MSKIIYSLTNSLLLIIGIIGILQVNSQSISSTSPSDSYPSCGLYYQHPTLNKRMNLPLKSVTYNVDIDEAIARVELIQNYYNDQDITINTEYNFPISDNSVFDQFSATIGEKVIVGEIKKKEEAQQIYAQQQAAGNTVAYSEITAGVDVMKIQIGNLLAKQEVQITFSYLEQLEVSLNKFWRFVIFSTLVPRYTPVNSTSNQASPNIVTTTDQAYPWYVNVNIKSKNNITNVRIPTHSEAKVTVVSPLEVKVAFDSNIKVYPNKDYELYYQTVNQFAPQAIVEKHPTIANSYVGFIEFFPIFNTYSDDIAYSYIQQMSSSKSNIPAVLADDGKYAKLEFLFILDRSGSMGGTRIQNLKTAMDKILDILPGDAYFNMYYFGSTFDKFSPTSSLVSLNRLAAKTALISVDANYGGTEIYDPIKAAINSPMISEYPKIIILLTDGNVSNSDQIIKLVKDNTNLARTFAIGIGNGISNYFIKNVGLQGLGGYDYVKDTDNLEERTKSIVYKMITPYLRNINLTWNPSITVTQTRPNLARLSFLAKNEPFKFFFFVDATNFDVSNNINFTISYYSSYTSQTEAYNFSISKSQAKSSDRLHKQAYKGLIDDNRFDKVLTDAQVIDMSLKYQILCEQTAFIVIIQKNDPNNTGVTNPTVTVPTQTSIDYSNTTTAGSIGQINAVPAPTSYSPSSSATTSSNFIKSGWFLLILLLVFLML